MVERLKPLGLLLLLGVLLSLSGLAGPSGLPTCVHQEAAGGNPHWQCTGEGLMGELVSTLAMFAKHLTAVLHNPPKDIQLLLYNYKQESLELPISKSYRIYKEQLMLPTEEILNPWDWSYGGDGPIFFIDRQSPETIYFLEAPKKDPDCEVDWTPLEDYFKPLHSVQDLDPIQQVFTEDWSLTQNIRIYYYLPSELPVWEYIIWLNNSDLYPNHHLYYQMNPVVQNRVKYLPERDLNICDNDGCWILAFALKDRFDKANSPRIFFERERGLAYLSPTDLTWDAIFENSKFIIATTNLPSYTSEFPFEPYIKNNATLWRPQELGVDLGPEFDYLQPWPFIDIPVQVELAEPVDWERLKGEFQERYGAELEQLRRELQDFGADPAVLDITNWQFGTKALAPGNYTITIDGAIGLTDPTQPASEAHFQGITVSPSPLQLTDGS